MIYRLLIRSFALAGAIVCACAYGQLSSRAVDPMSFFIRQPDDETLVSGWYFLRDTATGYVRSWSEEGLNVDPMPIVTAGNIIEARVEWNRIGKVHFVQMQLDEYGTRRFAWATGQSIGDQLVFILCDTIMYAPIVQAEILKGTTALHSGIGTKQEMTRLLEVVEIERKKVPPFFRP